MSIGARRLRRVGVSDAVSTPATVAPTAWLSWMEPSYFITGTGNQTVATASRFDGDAITYSLRGTVPSGVSINPSTGVVTVSTTSQFNWASVIVRATNSLGYAEVELPLRVITPTHTITGGAAFSTISPPAGSKVVVRAGTYTSLQNISGWSGTSSNKTEVFAYPGEDVHFNATGMTGTRILTVGNGSHIVIRGFRFTDDGGVNWGVLGDGGASNITVAQCRFRGFKRGALSFGWINRSVPRPWFVEYCRITDCVRENQPIGTFPQGGWGRGIFGDLGDNSVIRRNWVYENQGEGACFLGVVGGTITENIVYDNYSVNIYLDNTANCTVTNNIVWSNKPAFYRSGNPAVSVLCSDEDYGSDTQYHVNVTGNVVTNNRILQGLTMPFYDGSYGRGTGPGTSVFSPNAVITSAQLDPRWRAE